MDRGVVEVQFVHWQSFIHIFSIVICKLCKPKTEFQYLIINSLARRFNLAQNTTETPAPEIATSVQGSFRIVQAIRSSRIRFVRHISR